ncbi:MAG: hypothetical protein PUD14_04995 [Prevotellaceae bacterium]|nr:hypothetical protein [Prevotellaceae bacterium]
MGYILDDLQNTLDDFKQCVSKELTEIHNSKREVQELKNQIAEMTKGIKFVRDDNTMILSSPRIIIGNVDASGTMFQGGSEIILRGTNIRLEGVGDDSGSGGTISNRAATIENIAVDPGMDGKESLVCSTSQLLFQANNICMRADSDKGTFASGISSLPGINLTSDSTIGINATPSYKTKKEAIETRLTQLQTSDTNLQTQIGATADKLKNIFNKITETLDNQYSLSSTEEDSRNNHVEIRDIQRSFKKQSEALVACLNSYVSLISDQAEVKRCVKDLNKIKEDLEAKKDAFKENADKPVNARVSIQSESVSIKGTDGDGNVRVNPEAGLHVEMPHVTIAAKDGKDNLLEKGNFTVNAHDINISTANFKPTNDEHTKGDISVEGNVTIQSKNITVEAIDREVKEANADPTEKALAAEGTISMRARTIKAEATETDGKSTGSIALNAKDVKVASMDVDKDSRKDKALAEGSQMVLVSDKMFIGGADKNNKSKLVQTTSSKISSIAKDAVEMQQNEGKAVVTLFQDSAFIGGNSNCLRGNTEIDGDNIVRGKATVKVAKIEGLEVTSSFESPRMKDIKGHVTPGKAGKPTVRIPEQEPVKQQEQQ